VRCLLTLNRYGEESRERSLKSRQKSRAWVVPPRKLLVYVILVISADGSLISRSRTGDYSDRRRLWARERAFVDERVLTEATRIEVERKREREREKERKRESRVDSSTKGSIEGREQGTRGARIGELVSVRNGQPTRDGHHRPQSQAGESSQAAESEPRYARRFAKLALVTIRDS